MKKVEMKKTKKVSSYIFDIVILIIVLPIILISMMVIYKSIVYPTKIPDIFSYKPFIILDENMERSLQYGDLAITKMINTNKLKIGDVIAFRDNNNVVIIHEIVEIKETQDGKELKMKASKNEADEIQCIKDTDVEGILVSKIGGLGNIFMYLQDPKVLFLIIIIISIVGVISYYIAEKLDERDDMKEFKKFDM